MNGSIRVGICNVFSARGAGTTVVPKSLATILAAAVGATCQSATNNWRCNGYLGFGYFIVFTVINLVDDVFSEKMRNLCTQKDDFNSHFLLESPPNFLTHLFHG